MSAASAAAAAAQRKKVLQEAAAKDKDHHEKVVRDFGFLQASLLRLASTRCSLYLSSLEDY